MAKLLNLLGLATLIAAVGGCGGSEGPEATPATTMGRPQVGSQYIDKLQFEIVRVVEDQGDRLLVSGSRGHTTVPVVAATTRLIPVRDLESKAWVGPDGDVAVVFRGLSEARLRDLWHVPGDVWHLEEGHPVRAVKLRHDLSVALVLSSYRPQEGLLKEINDLQERDDAELRRLQIDRLKAAADSEMDALLFKAELELAARKELWEQYVESRKQSKRVVDDTVYRGVLTKAGIFGEGWYAARSDLKSWAQVIAVANIGPEAIWFRLWTPQGDGSWDVRMVDTPPLVFAANYMWIGDVPGEYPAEGAGDTIEVTVVPGSPPMLRYSQIAGGDRSSMDAAQLPPGWSVDRRLKPLPLPKAMQDRLDELVLESRVWLRPSIGSASND